VQQLQYKGGGVDATPVLLEAQTQGSVSGEERVYDLLQDILVFTGGNRTVEEDIQWGRLAV